MQKMPHMKARSEMRSYGRYFKLRINVSSLPSNACVLSSTVGQTSLTLQSGSKHIFDLYYDKEAISKQLYDWLLKNNYADANLIAKWKKQGYEKVGGYAKSHFECELMIAA